MLVNQKELARVLGITDRRVRQLREEGFFSFSENGKRYELEKCVPEFIEYKVKAETGNGALLNKDQEQAKHEIIKKEISKLRLRKLRKELHEAQDVEYFLSNMLLNFRNRLLAIPAKVAMQVVGEKDVHRINNILQKEMLETLEELSEYDPEEINGEIDDIEEEEEENEDAE